MDIMGPLLEAPEKLKYLIVAIDYFNKWLEAKPLASIAGRQVKNFSFDNIECRFRVPATIITDNGTQLINEPFKSWAKGLEIKVTPRGKMMGRGTTERVLGLQDNAKTSNEETPLSLVYDTKAVTPEEIETWMGKRYPELGIQAIYESITCNRNE
ncbi:reverse transcriptase domain-containing protein [Tanacetum coccineum]